MLAALLTPILFSLSVVCGHRSAKLIGGTEANFWRITAASIFLGFWAYGTGSGLSGVALPLLVLSGVVGIGIGDVAFFQGLPRLGSRLSLLLIECLAPPFAALIEWLWLGTTLSVRQIVWGLLVLFGVGLALSPSDHLRRDRRSLWVGTWFCVLAALATAGGAVLSRKAFQDAECAGESPDPMTAAFQRVVGGAVVAGICLLVVKRAAWQQQARDAQGLISPALVGKWRGVWLWIVLNSLAGQTLGVSCMQAALKTIPTGIVLAIIAITPIVVIPLTIVFEKERPTALSLLGGLLGVAGVIGLVLSR